MFRNVSSLLFAFRKESSSASVPIQEILSELGEKINNNQVNRFNINRAAVLDGAIRGFKRISYDPTHRISVRFSDDKGKTEEAVDLGGPRREFLRLLTEALAQSEMFEGTEGNLNLALDATGTLYLVFCFHDITIYNVKYIIAPTPFCVNLSDF